MNRTTLISLLDQYGIIPDSDTLDQHFIVSESAVKAVIDAAHLSEGEHVIEIGPGPGQLTREMLKQGAFVTAIELDLRFQSLLCDLERESNGRLRLIWGSALTEPWPREAEKLVMNPPYSILEPLLERIHETREIKGVSMIIGKKYYLNAVAKVGSGDFTKTALMTQARFDPNFVADLDKDSFYPEAGGRSVIMTLVLKNKPHPVLYRLADLFVLDPQASANFVIQQALEPLNKRARKYKKFEEFVTIGKLGLRPELLSKRLQDLSNNDIQLIVAKLSRQYNLRFAKKSSFKIEEEDD